MHKTLKDAIESLEKLSHLTTSNEKKVADDIKMQTQKVVDDLTGLMDQMKAGELTLSKEEIIQLTAALQQSLDILNKEVQESKAKLKAQMRNAQAHKSYSGS